MRTRTGRRSRTIARSSSRDDVPDTSRRVSCWDWSSSNWSRNWCVVKLVPSRPSTHRMASASTSVDSPTNVVASSSTSSTVPAVV